MRRLVKGQCPLMALFVVVDSLSINSLSFVLSLPSGHFPVFIEMIVALCLSLSLSLSPSVYVCLSVSVSVSACLPACLSVCLSLCICLSLSLSLSLSGFVGLGINAFPGLCVHIFVYRVVYVDMSTRSSQLNHSNLEF